MRTGVLTSGKLLSTPSSRLLTRNSVAAREAQEIIRLGSDRRKRTTAGLRSWNVDRKGKAGDEVGFGKCHSPADSSLEEVGPAVAPRPGVDCVELNVAGRGGKAERGMRPFTPTST